MQRGRLIVLEGLDGSGKSTISAELCAVLGAVPWTTPSPLLRAARPLVEPHLAAAPMAGPLFFASTVLAASAQMQAVLASGQDIVCDRYWLTTLAYARAAGVPLALPAVEQRLVPADITLLLCVEHAARCQRLRARRENTSADAETCRPENARRLLQQYRALARHPIAGRFHEIDLTGLTPQQAAARCVNIIGQASAQTPRQLMLPLQVQPSMT